MIIIMSERQRSVCSIISKAISGALVFVIFLSIGFISPASAGLFQTNLASGVDNFSASFDTVDEAFDQLTTAELQAALPSYVDPVSTATAVINYRGLDMNFAFSTANSTELTLTIPELGISESFVGATRDDSKDLLVDFLEGEGADTVDRIQKELARVSPTDPVAGNPGSLMGQQIDMDFAMATSLSPSEFAHTPGGMRLLRSVMPASRRVGQEGVSSRLAGEESNLASSQTDMSASSGSSSTSGSSSSVSSSRQGDVSDSRISGVRSDGSSESTNSESGHDETYAQSIDGMLPSPGGILGVDLSHRSLDLEGDRSNTETLVIEYAYHFEDPLKVARVKMPLAVTDTEGAKSYHANIGLDFSYPVTRSWSLTPGVSYGVGGSEDLGGGASINGYSLTSTYRLVHGDYLFTLGNMVGRYQTGSVSLGDYEIDPDVSNTVLRNGLVVFRPSLVFGLPAMVQGFLIDTRFSGDELFTEHYYELGFALGLITDESLVSEDTLNIGLTYLDATDADITGYKLNFGYRF